MIRAAFAVVIAVGFTALAVVAGWIAVVDALSRVIGFPATITVCILGALTALAYMAWAWSRTDAEESVDA